MEIYDIHKARAIDWRRVEPEPLGGDMAEDVILFMNHACRYSLGKWWRIKKYDKEAQEHYLTMRGGTEKNIRPAGATAKLLAVTIKFRIYDEFTVRAPLYVAQDKCCKLIRSTAYHHIANKQGGWGLHNQSGEWVIDLVTAGWLMWDKLNIRDKQLIANLLEYEANNLIFTKSQFQYDIKKAEQKGASKTLECRYNAIIMYLAVLILQGHQNSHKWEAKAKEYFISASVMPSDLIDRAPKFLDGYNVNEDGTITSYGVISPYAMSKINISLSNIIYCKLAGEKMPSETLFNAKKIYEALYTPVTGRNSQSQSSICALDKKGRPTCIIQYPQGVKGNRASQSDFYLTELFGYFLGFDENLEHKSREWAKQRMKKMLTKQGKKTNGNYYTSSNRAVYHGSSEKVAGNMASAYMLMFVMLSDL